MDRAGPGPWDLNSASPPTGERPSDADRPHVGRACDPQGDQTQKTAVSPGPGDPGDRPEATVVIGDQLFTDVLGGNRMDLYTILINPMSKEELGTTKIVRKVERRVLNRLYRKGLIDEAELELRGVDR